MKSIDIVMIPVRDRQAAKAFYQQLGFEVVVEAPDAHGDTWIQMGMPNGNTTIALAGFHGIICDTDDIEKEVEALAQKGVSVGKIDETPWGRFAWLKDEDGNRLCLRQLPVHQFKT